MSTVPPGTPERQSNPFRPGFNQQPAVLVGRDVVLTAAEEALDIAALDGRTPRPVMLVGPRGVGKTVALNEISNKAVEKYGWPTIHVELRPRTRFSPALVELLHDTATRLDGATVNHDGRLHITETTLSAQVLGVGAEVSLAPGDPDSPAVPLEAALTACMDVAMRRGAGVVLSFDELQLAERAELADLTAVLQSHVPDNWPLVLTAAGLPNLREPRRSVTYLERAEWHELGLLTDADSLEALTQPAADAGRPMRPAAARVLAAAAGGYPYALQVMGHHAWRASTGQSRINEAAAHAAVDAAQADLSAGLYAARWADASDKEREYLRALAELQAAAGTGASITGKDVSDRLGTDTRAISYLRDRLLKKGTLFAEAGTLRFVTPGMGAWILDRGDA